ncbi:hypothetical protein MJH12_08470, partial [bacterium]|nr:hypothetical protein [bacterium]
MKPQPPLHNYLVSFDRKIALASSAFVLILLVTISIIASYFQASVSHKNQRQLEEVVVSLLVTSIKGISSSGNFHSRKLIETFVENEPRLSYIMIVSDQGIVNAHSDSGQNEILISKSQLLLMKKVIQSQNSHISKTTYDSESIHQFILPFNSGYQDKTKGTIFVGLSNQYYKSLANDSSTQLLIVIMALTCFSLVFSFYFGKKFGAPVVTMALRFQAILDKSPLTILMNSKKSGLSYRSSQYDQLSKLYPDLLLDQPQDVFENKNEIEEQLHFKNIDEIEKYLYCVSFPLSFDAQGEVIESCSIAMDNTNQIKAETAIRENEETLRTTLNAITNGVITTNSFHQIVHMNSIAEEMLELKLDQIKFQKFHQLFKLSDANLENF